MNSSDSVPNSGSPVLPSRRSGTPPGYRNVRVLVPLDLHWRLASYATQSKMTMPMFVLATLQNATPIDLSTAIPGISPSVTNQPPTGPGPCPQSGPGLAVNTQPGQDPARSSGSPSCQGSTSISCNPLPTYSDASSSPALALDSMSESEATLA